MTGLLGGSGFSGFVGGLREQQHQLAQQQQNSTAERWLEAAVSTNSATSSLYHAGRAYDMAYLPPSEKHFGNIREELQHETDEWLKGILE